MIDMNINISVTVKVRLTTLGKELYEKSGRNEFVRWDEDGLLETELWNLMVVFGPHFNEHVGPFFENNAIYVVDLRNDHDHS